MRLGVLEKVPDRNLWLVNLAILVLATAYGLALSVLAVWLEKLGFRGEMGSMATFFALGIALFAAPASWLIRRLSARVTLILSLAGYAIAVGIFPLFDSYFALAFVRFWDGAFSVGIWVSCETIVLSRAPAQHKAYCTSLYAICMALGYVIGPIMSSLLVGPWGEPAAFYFAGGLALVTSGLVALRLDPDVQSSYDDPDEEAGPASGRPTLANLFWRIKTSSFATFSYGYFQASVVLLLPLFLKNEKGMTEEQVIRIPAFFAAGMLLFSNIAGRLGDRFGHLRLMRWLGVAGTSAILGFVFLDSHYAMQATVFFGGAALASVSPVSLALQGHVSKPYEFRNANMFYNALYASGMLIGPPVSEAIAERVGYVEMLYHLAALWVAFVIFTMIFAKDDPIHRRRLA